MLIKLMKHEFRATARTMVPLFLVLLVTAGGANLSVRVLMERDMAVLNLFGGLLIMAFVVAAAAACIMSMVVMVQRFYKNLLQDEGYVMMTLPVSVHQHIWSKLIVSAVWFAATALMFFLAIFIVAADIRLVWQFLRGCADIFTDLTAYYALNGTAIALELLLLAFLGSCTMCLSFYASLAAGHSRPNHKMRWSVVCFFAIQFAQDFLLGLLMSFMSATGLDYTLAQLLPNLSDMAGVHAGLLLAAGAAALGGAVYYGITAWFLTRHLNLE